MDEGRKIIINSFKKAVESIIGISYAPIENIIDLGYLYYRLYDVIRETFKDHIVIDRRNHMVLDYAGNTVIIRKENESSNN